MLLKAKYIVKQKGNFPLTFAVSEPARPGKVHPLNARRFFYHKFAFPPAIFNEKFTNSLLVAHKFV